MSLGAGNLLLASAVEGYNLTRSLRLRASATANLSQTITTSATWALSVWVKRGVLSAISPIFGDGVKFLANDTLTAGSLTTAAVYRDPSSWYHLYVSNLGLYINGLLLGSVTTSALTNPRIGSNGTNYFDGELAEFNFINGATPAVTAFGSLDPITGVWKAARYSGSYPTGSSYVPFTDNSALTTSSNVGLGKDFSGNGNYWATNNISITSGVTYDSMTDVPTLTSATAANFAVLNPLDNGGLTISSANLNTSDASGAYISVRATIGVSSGKWYWEETATSGANLICGISKAAAAQSSGNYVGVNANGWGYAGNNGQKYTAGAGVAYGATYTNGDVVGVAFDADAGTLTFYKNNTSQGTAFTGLTSGPYFPAVSNYSSSWATNFGQRPFTYTPPTGFVALNTFNLPTSTIVKGNTVMDATLYTGNGSTQSIVNAAAFKPDLVWVKGRSNATNHKLTDSVRGTTKALSSNLTDAEITDANGLTAFNSNGFTLGLDSSYNATSNTMVAWQWQAGQGSTSSNTNGSITSTVSVNASAGFSVVTYTGNGTNGATVGHGLGVAPAFFVVKTRGVTGNWQAYHSALTGTTAILLDSTGAAFASSAYWNNTNPTSSVFSLGTSSFVNVASQTQVAYCWTPIAGYSAFGSVSTNGAADNAFVYTGFLPRFVMLKRTDSTSDWIIWDTARNTFNVMGNRLYPNLSNAETSVTDIDLLSNGFKLRSSGFSGTWIYAAFATAPFKNSLGF